MKILKQIFIVICLSIVCTTQSGCALFSLPGQILGGLFNLGSQALSVAQSMPKPPPWMFF